jgi:hypothetical protein
MTFLTHSCGVIPRRLSIWPLALAAAATVIWLAAAGSPEVGVGARRMWVRADDGVCRFLPAVEAVGSQPCQER